MYSDINWTRLGNIYLDNMWTQTMAYVYNILVLNKTNQTFKLLSKSHHLYGEANLILTVSTNAVHRKV